jgi:hypothetical protein
MPSHARKEQQCNQATKIANLLSDERCPSEPTTVLLVEFLLIH